MSIVEQGVLFPHILAYEDWKKRNRSENKAIGIFYTYGSESTQLGELTRLDGLLPDYAQYFGNLLRSVYKTRIWSFEEIKRAIIVKGPKKEAFYNELILPHHIPNTINT